jgi:phosphate transport system protein
MTPMTDELPLLEGHIARAFDGDLAALQLRVTTMGALVLSQVQGAVSAYADWRADMAQAVVAREPLVNSTEQQIDQEALRLIARRQPMAHDLRAILSFERSVSDLERIGDEANKIARLVLVGRDAPGSEHPAPSTAREVRQLGRLASQLVRAAVEAFDAMDSAAAALVIQRDRELDEEYAAGLRRLLTRAMEDPRQLQATVQSAFVLKSIERIGDHARNVAEQVVELITAARAAQTSVGGAQQVVDGGLRPRLGIDAFDDHGAGQ